MPFELEFEDRFQDDSLDPGRWLGCYLPHWSSRDRSEARYVTGRGLSLRIEADQEPWCPEWDGDVRVSSIQTGTFSGPLGSTIGQHRFHPDAVVRQEQRNVLLYGPRYGRIGLRARVSSDSQTMVALWMIGYEDEPERSAEICVCEIFGSEIEAGRALVGMGIHPFGDPKLQDTFSKEPLAIDVTEPHEYAVEWIPGRSSFFVDGDLVKSDDQAPDYPMQLMLGIYEFSRESKGGYPKEFRVDYVRGYRYFDGRERA
jgi:hypothetical protein